MMDYTNYYSKFNRENLLIIIDRILLILIIYLIYSISVTKKLCTYEFSPVIKMVSTAIIIRGLEAGIFTFLGASVVNIVYE